MSRWARFALAAVGGGLFISLGDHLFHVRTQVLVHHWHPQVDGQMLSVIPTFVVAAAAMLLVATPFVADVPRPSTARLATAGAAFYVAYWFTGLVGRHHPVWCFVVLLATFAARLPFEPDRRAVVVVGLLIAVGGCAAEALTSAAGTFDYLDSRWIVPAWLFPLYLNGAAAVVGLTRLVDLAGADDRVAADAPVPVDAVRSR